jgi:hypothetical protein
MLGTWNSVQPQMYITGILRLGVDCSYPAAFKMYIQEMLPSLTVELRYISRLTGSRTAFYCK